MHDTQLYAAEFGDLFRIGDRPEPPMRDLGAVLAKLAVPAALPVLDLGAGTGLGTLALADALPNPVYAVERSRSMRSVLFSRIAVRTDLRDRVTVVPGDVLDAPLPETWGGAIAIHLLCQLDPDQRRLFWRLLRARLAPGAPAVIDTCFGLTEVRAQDNHLVVKATQGDRTYERWYSSTATGPATMRSVVTYRVLSGDRCLEEFLVEREVSVTSPEAIPAEIAAAGLRVEQVDEKYLALYAA